MAPSVSPSAASYAAYYARMSGNCTTHLARTVLQNIKPAIAAETSHVLDNASGPGIVTSVLKATHPALRITCSDTNAAMLDEVRVLASSRYNTSPSPSSSSSSTPAATQQQQQGVQQAWAPGSVHTAQLDARDLHGLRDASFSHVVTNLGLPVPGDADEGGAPALLHEAHRVLVPGGLALLTTWADRVWPAAFERAAERVRPGAACENRMRLEGRFLGGGWLVARLEAQFGRRVEVRCERT